MDSLIDSGGHFAQTISDFRMSKGVTKIKVFAICLYNNNYYYYAIYLYMCLLFYKICFCITIIYYYLLLLCFFFSSSSSFSSLLLIQPADYCSPSMVDAKGQPIKQDDIPNIFQ